MSTATRSFDPEITPRPGGDWIETLARAGYAAKGMVYLLVGVLAAQAAFGSGDPEGSAGALRTLVDEPLGQAFLAVIALGLVGYVVWRVVAAVRDPERRGTGPRVFFAVSALVYGLLAVEAVRLAVGSGGAAGSDHWIERLVARPYGLLLLGLAGALLAGYGLYRLYQAWRVDLDDRLDLSAFGPEAARAVVLLGRFGYAARGAVFALMGGLAVMAAVTANPEQAEPMGGLLESLEGRPWILGTLAAGFIAYALYNFVRAGYRRIRTGSSAGAASYG
ncbi:MAG TPA: DUF1206 domain-containing protein [Longimicrobiales bacterium]|nr:DUF1206 domain-containing protein [Longimicrobiales bacterium]